jgi:hypothetical protein
MYAGRYVAASTCHHRSPVTTGARPALLCALLTQSWTPAAVPAHIRSWTWVSTTTTSGRPLQKPLQPAPWSTGAGP